MQTHLFFWQDIDVKRVNTRFLVASLILLGALAGSGCRGDVSPSNDSSDVRSAAQAVRTWKTRAQPIEQTVDYVGTVAASQRISVTAQLPGTLKELAVDQGDPVTAGQVLGHIEATEVEARRGQIRAEIRRASTESSYLCDRYQTDKRLVEAGVLSQAKLDASRSQCRGSKEAVEAARARLEELEATLAKGTVRSPHDGYVLERLAEPGEDVGPGRPLLVLATGGTEVRVPVVETDLRRGIDVGTAVTIRVPSDVSFAGEVIDIAPAARGPGRSAEATIEMGADAPKLRHGMSVDVLFQLAKVDDATVVPREALVKTDDGYAIFIVEADTARRIDITPGISQGGMVAVEPPLDDGTRVALSNLDVLRDEMRVYPVDARRGER